MVEGKICSAVSDMQGCHCVCKQTIGLLRYRTSVYRPLVCYRPSAYRPFCICGPYWDPILLGPYVHCTSSQVLNGFKRSAMQQQTCTGPSNSAIVTSDSFVLEIPDSVSMCISTQAQTLVSCSDM